MNLPSNKLMNEVNDSKGSNFFVHAYYIDIGRIAHAIRTQTLASQQSPLINYNTRGIV